MDKQLVKKDDQHTIIEQKTEEIAPEETMVATTDKNIVAQLAEIPSIKKIVAEINELIT